MIYCLKPDGFIISLVVCGGADKQILESYEAHKED